MTTPLFCRSRSPKAHACFALDQRPFLALPREGSRLFKPARRNAPEGCKALAWAAGASSDKSRFLRRIGPARSAFREPFGMVGVGGRRQDRSRRKGARPAEPVRAAIDHDPSIFAFDKQAATASARFPLAGRASRN